MFLIGGVALYVTVTKIQLQTGLWSGLEFWVKAVKYLTGKIYKKKKKVALWAYFYHIPIPEALHYLSQVKAILVTARLQEDFSLTALGNTMVSGC